ncbi:MAG: glycerol-3-phosphate 1-O-acyltransferase PlsY [Planctomycetota bacterium]|nr:glycerol-3-phosphate 1-O-acyltransferase PlsY [Planctomycetota bacterium]
MTDIAALAIAYLAGAIPFSFLIGKLYGVDIRLVGSGNVGATNLKRAIGGRRFGPVACRLALFLDAAKGFLPAFFLADFLASRGSFLSIEWLRVAMGIASVFGHTFTIFLRFRGGKGVATSAGALLAIAPAEACVALAVWLGVRIFSGYVSAASCAAALSLLPAAVAFRCGNLSGDGLPALAFGTVAAALVIIRHRENIVRLWRGTEPRAGPILAFGRPAADEAGERGAPGASAEKPQPGAGPKHDPGQSPSAGRSRAGNGSSGKEPVTGDRPCRSASGNTTGARS